MEEFILYINTLKDIIARHYEKEMVFYNDGKWYSREHCRNITPQELCEWILELTAPTQDDNDNLCDDILPCGCCSCCGCTCNED